jgi:hypothetical protein
VVVGGGRYSFTLNDTLSLALNDSGSRKKVAVASLFSCSSETV